jgi:hypothetical protein
MIDGPLTLSPSDDEVATVMSGFCARRVAVTRAAAAGRDAVVGWRTARSGSSASAQTIARE